jgi:hypothetical protein
MRGAALRRTFLVLVSATDVIAEEGPGSHDLVR